MSTNFCLSTPCLAMKSAIDASLSSGWRSTWIALNTLGLSCVAQAERFQRVIQALLRHEGFIEGDRHPLEDDIVALLLDPVSQRRLESMAMRAAVPEEFGDFDFFAGIGLLRLVQGTEIDAVFRIIGAALTDSASRLKPRVTNNLGNKRMGSFLFWFIYGLARQRRRRHCLTVFRGYGSLFRSGRTGRPAPGTGCRCRTGARVTRASKPSRASLALVLSASACSRNAPACR